MTKKEVLEAMLREEDPEQMLDLIDDFFKESAETPEEAWYHLMQGDDGYVYLVYAKEKE